MTKISKKRAEARAARAAEYAAARGCAIELTELQNVIARHDGVTISELALMFQVSPSRMRAAVELLWREDRVYGKPEYDTEAVRLVWRVA